MTLFRGSFSPIFHKIDYRLEGRILEPGKAATNFSWAHPGKPKSSTVIVLSVEAPRMMLPECKFRVKAKLHCIAVVLVGEAARLPSAHAL